MPGPTTRVIFGATAVNPSYNPVPARPAFADKLQPRPYGGIPLMLFLTENLSLYATIAAVGSKTGLTLQSQCDAFVETCTLSEEL